MVTKLPDLKELDALEKVGFPLPDGPFLKVSVDVCNQLRPMLDLIEQMGAALPDPGKLRVLADWFDRDDAEKGRNGPTLATLGGQPWDEVQRYLRRWADEIDAALAAWEQAKEGSGD